MFFTVRTTINITIVQQERMIMEMSEKIIVIDDNPEIREVVNVLLSSEGYTILEAKNAEEAL